MAGLVGGNPDPFGGYLGLLGGSRIASSVGGGGLLDRAQKYRSGQIDQDIDRQNAEIMQYGRPLNAFERYTQALPAQTPEGVQETLTNTIGGNFGGPMVARAVDTAVGNVASGVAGKVGQFFDPRVPQGIIPAPAFHGTPHRFDKFELSPDTLGTGEGAQAYGHGLYFAENRGIAEGYRDALTPSVSFRFDNTPIDLNDLDLTFPGMSNEETQQVIDGLVAFPPPGKRSARSIEDAIANAREYSEIDRVAASNPQFPLSSRQSAQARVDKADAMIAAMEKAKGRVTADAGHFYEVDIPDDAIAMMLDLDAPLDEQAPAVQETLQRIGLWGGDIDPKRFNGRALYDDLSRRAGGDQAASDFLKESGIPGNKFWDGPSRKKGEGKRNFVVFDDEIITTVSRNGEPL